LSSHVGVGAGVEHRGDGGGLGLDADIVIDRKTPTAVVGDGGVGPGNELGDFALVVVARVAVAGVGGGVGTHRDAYPDAAADGNDGGLGVLVVVESVGVPVGHGIAGIVGGQGV
jgi:hypothetical protein